MEWGPSSMGLNAVQNSTRILRRHFIARSYVERAVFLYYMIPLFILNTYWYIILQEVATMENGSSGALLL